MTLRPNQPCFRCAPIAQRLIEQRDDCLAERDALRQEVERLRAGLLSLEGELALFEPSVKLNLRLMAHIGSVLGPQQGKGEP